MLGVPAEMESLRKLAQSLEPTALIFTKEDSPLMRFLNFFARVFNPTFMESAGVTIGNRIYLPSTWFGKDLSACIVHEARHITQCRWCGLGLSAWVGLPIFLVLYGLLAFPIFLAVFRYLFELDACAASWRELLMVGVSAEAVRKRAEQEAQVVAGWKYLRPWPKFLVIRGFKKKFEKVLAGFGVAHA